MALSLPPLLLEIIFCKPHRHLLSDLVWAFTDQVPQSSKTGWLVGFFSLNTGFILGWHLDVQVEMEQSLPS
jgi:hypothetical protein